MERVKHHSCCGEPTTQEHSPTCQGHADLQKVSESTKRDPERWLESYVHRNTESVAFAAKAARAAQNGHSVGVSR